MLTKFISIFFGAPTSVDEQTSKPLESASKSAHSLISQFLPSVLASKWDVVVHCQGKSRRVQKVKMVLEQNVLSAEQSMVQTNRYIIDRNRVCSRLLNRALIVDRRTNIDWQKRAVSSWKS